MHAAELAARKSTVICVLHCQQPLIVFDEGVRAVNVDFSGFGPKRGVQLNSFSSEGGLRVSAISEISSSEVYVEV